MALGFPFRMLVMSGALVPIRVKHATATREAAPRKRANSLEVSE